MALYRVFSDAVVGHGPMATKISAIAKVDPSNISYDRPLEFECPDDHDPSMTWECLDEAAEAAMQRLIDEKNEDPEQFYIDRHGNKCLDAGDEQRRRLYHARRVGVKSTKRGDFKVKPKANKPKPVGVSPSEVTKGDAEIAKGKRTSRKAI